MHLTSTVTIQMYPLTPATSLHNPTWPQGRSLQCCAPTQTTTCPRQRSDQALRWGTARFPGDKPPAYGETWSRTAYYRKILKGPSAQKIERIPRSSKVEVAWKKLILDI
jgi:hypothetical protein